MRKGRARFKNLRAYVERRLNTEPRLTKQKIASDLGVSPSALTLYLKGERIPQPAIALRIAAKAGVDLASLLEKAS